MLTGIMLKSDLILNISENPIFLTGVFIRVFVIFTTNEQKF
jgi:hypothetical protein